MRVVKRSVSFDADTWQQLASEAGAGPVSPLVNDAIGLYLRRRRGLAAVAAYEAEAGSLTEAELAKADRHLDDAGVADLRTAEQRPELRRRRTGGGEAAAPRPSPA